MQGLQGRNNLMAQGKEEEGVKETFIKVSFSSVISVMYQTTVVLPSGGGFLSHPHSWHRNHPSVPDLAGCLLSASPAPGRERPSSPKGP